MKFIKSDYVILQDKIEKELKPILPLLKKYRAMLCGGALRSLFTNTKINDYDIYFNNVNDYENFCHDLRKIQKKEDINLVSDTVNALTFVKVFDCELLKFQLIKDFEDNIKKVIEKFDFTVCSAGYDFEKKKFYLAQEFLDDNLNHRLIINDDYKLSTATMTFLKRVIKYSLDYRYKLDRYNWIKIFYAISQSEKIQEVMNQQKGKHLDGLLSILQSTDSDYDYFENAYDYGICLLKDNYKITDSDALMDWEGEDLE